MPSLGSLSPPPVPLPTRRRRRRRLLPRPRRGPGRRPCLGGKMFRTLRVRLPTRTATTTGGRPTAGTVPTLSRRRPTTTTEGSSVAGGGGASRRVPMAIGVGGRKMAQLVANMILVHVLLVLMTATIAMRMTRMLTMFWSARAGVKSPKLGPRRIGDLRSTAGRPRTMKMLWKSRATPASKMPSIPLERAQVARLVVLHQSRRAMMLQWCWQPPTIWQPMRTAPAKGRARRIWGIKMRMSRRRMRTWR
mmetsp:Transcript_38291/g.121949  ORF Transcript_38291/g.121949 Transcript_38291/m.121949 type:complete len:248 (+) Transcript_38291:1042-1785(+)